MEQNVVNIQPGCRNNLKALHIARRTLKMIIALRNYDQGIFDLQGVHNPDKSLGLDFINLEIIKDHHQVIAKARTQRHTQAEFLNLLRNLEGIIAGLGAKSYTTPAPKRRSPAPGPGTT